MKNKRTESNTATIVKTDANRDPITGEPGAHPIGVGTGGAGGGMAGAAIGGLVAGPIGAAVGAVAGVVAGGLAGKGVAEAINPTTEHAFWRIEYARRPYFNQSTPYEEFGPAYQYGWESQARYSAKGKTFEEVEADLQTEWDRRRGVSKLNWEHAKGATRDAWKRVEKNSCTPCKK